MTQIWLANNRQKMSVALTAFLASMYQYMPLVSAADLKSAGKSGGSQVILILIIFTLILAAISILGGILAWTTNISWLAQAGTKRMLVGCGGLAGALLFSMFFTWLYQSATGAGGGLGFHWPF
ncbi:hypothetical protein JK159_02280 [Weissella minor]|uniref:hypothetical protein n=1 Tax=Weissella minor TaxID=1620 RepID=UPI001BB09356|nr:hypothetical protein [Weissella minor]MBS0949210.1 hypothetical protein [Weissella minor]